jgi:hypothetical protein
MQLPVVAAVAEVEVAPYNLLEHKAMAVMEVVSVY